MATMEVVKKKKKMNMERKSIPLGVKLKVIEDLESGKYTNKQLMKKYGFKNYSNIYSINNKKEKIKSKAKQFDVSKLDSVKHLKGPEHPQLELSLKLWISEMQNRDCPLTNRKIADQAMVFADKLGIDRFNASLGYVDRFLKRNDIKLDRMSGQTLDANSAIEWQDKIDKFVQAYGQENIFNAKETGLYWRLLPSKKATKKSERMTIFLISNVTGSSKFIAAISRPKCPRRFDSSDSLLWYYQQSNCWMNNDIFEKILSRINLKMRRKQKKALFILDNSAVHSGCTFSNIDFEFVSQSSAVVQPANSIIRSFKCNYRKVILRNLLIKLRENIDTKIADIKFTDAMHMVTTAWNEVDTSTIINSFRDCGFDLPLDEMITSEIEDHLDDQDLIELLWHEVKRLRNDVSYECADDYIDCDAQLVCTHSLTDQEIIEVVNQQSSNNELEDESTGDIPTHSQALQAVQSLRRYLNHYGSSQKIDSELSKIEKLIYRSSSSQQNEFFDASNYLEVQIKDE